MSHRPILAIIAIAGGSISGLTGSIVFNDIIAAVNAKLPPQEQFDYLFWGWTKRQRLFTCYKALYPEGKLIRSCHRCVAAMFLSLLLAACMLGFFGL